MNWLPILTLFASPFDEAHRVAVAQDPPDLLFRAELADGRTKFRQGETIKLNLVYSSSSFGKYRLDAAQYDRSGRLESDAFHVDPSDGVVDPIADYFSSIVAVFGGGLRSMPTLDSSSTQVAVDLNEWIRFDRPGRYRLYVTSRRVSYSAASGGVAVTSKLLEFEIVPPDSKWEAEVIRRAGRNLDSQDGREKRTAGCRLLRFLGSRAAVDEIIRRYRPDDRDCSFEFIFGLIGAPDRSFVVARMEGRLRANHGEVDSSFIRNLALLRYKLDHPGKPSDLKQQRSGIDSLVQRYSSGLASSLPQKDASAKATGAEALLDLLSANQWPADRTEADRVRAALTKNFLDLPVEKQGFLLTYRWTAIRSPEMVPILKQAYSRGRKTPTVDVPTIAVRRLYELDPVAARRIILDEARKPQPNIGPAALGVLSDPELPELDGILADNLERLPPTMAGWNEVMFLVSRYATKAILPRVERVLSNHRGCWMTPAIAYILRVAPDRGERLLAQRIGDHTENCHRGALRSVAKLSSSPRIARVALAHLDDADLDIAIEAVEILKVLGPAAAEQALHTRLDRWRQKWKGHEDQLRRDPVTFRGSNDTELRLQAALIDALATGLGWLADAKKLRALKELCLTPDGGPMLEQWIKAWESPPNMLLTIIPAPDGTSMFGVAQYQNIHSREAFDRKLKQFPRDMTLHWPGTDDSTNPEYSRVKALVESHGLHLVPWGQSTRTLESSPTGPK
jgi:hypothetical protein